MQFRVDDSVLFAGSPTTQVRIEVEYFDQGTDSFFLQYDAAAGAPYGDGTINETELFSKTDSGSFKTAVFTLEDVYFANRINGADFRIDGMDDGAEIIRSVTVTLLKDSTRIEDVADIIFFNGNVITMDDSQPMAEAIAIQGDKILAVGDNASILALKKPPTQVVDLKGQTLMPGFVDPHNHWFNNRGDYDFENSQASLLAYGITTSAEIGVSEDLMESIRAFSRDGKLRMRLSLYPGHVDNCGNILGNWYVSDYPVSREPGALLQIPGIKIFNDGGSCNLPAYSFPHRDGQGYGDLYFQVDELAEMIIEAQNLGYQVAIHSIGDHAIDVTLSAIEIALDGSPNIYHHRIEHNATLREDQLPRYSEVDVVALIFGVFPTCASLGDTPPWGYWPLDEYSDWNKPNRALVTTNPGVHFAWHSDAPPVGNPNPMRHIHGFVTRRGWREDGTVCEPPAYAADDTLHVERVLPMMTIDAAYAVMREDEIGSLKAGKLADLIVLSADPLEVDPDAILDIQVWMTMVGGNVEFCMDGHEDVCP
jgi:predicted amidohydrolase YtcJ